MSNVIATQGFERLRDGSLGSLLDDDSSGYGASSPVHYDSIAEYCAESLYSYSFTPLSRANKAARIKRQILNRGMDYMQRIRWKTGERDAVRRFSEPDIGLASQWNDTSVEDQQQLKVCPSMVDIASTNNGFSACSPPSKSSSTKEKEPPILLNKPHNTDSVIPLEKNTNTAEEDMLLSRRQTIEVFNNLPPIYEVPNTTKSSISPQYTRALHAPSRFLPQNQAILTTDADATILLFNDMASLCFGIDKTYIGKSILEAIEEPFQKQIGKIMKRRKEVTSISSGLPTLLNKESKLEKGLVLVCGIVVPIKKLNGESSSAASLWLKEKKTDEGKSIYIWIFEEIYETSLTAHLDDKVIKGRKYKKINIKCFYY